MYYKVRHYQYKNRIGNLKSEAVGVVSGEKHFPIFPGNMIFKPLTKSKPFSTPLYAYAEVFWSTIINEYFMPAPRYELAICEGYEAVNEKYLDYGTAVPMAYKEGESLLNLLEFFRKYPDEKVDIDNYVNYCQMFYDYRDIFEADFLQEHQEMAEQLAMQVLISVLKGDQNYHYENVAFLCDKDGGIISLAPMIDHEFSTYFMFPDDISRHVYWLMELSKSIRGWEVRPGEYDNFKDPEERKLMEKSATCIHKNLLYIKEEILTYRLSYTYRHRIFQNSSIRKQNLALTQRCKDQYKDSCQCKTHTCKNDLTCRICRIHLHQTVSCLDQRDRTPPEKTADAGKRCHHPGFF